MNTTQIVNATVAINCLENETNLVHVLFLAHFVNFIYNVYMFRTFPSPSSGGTTLFMRHLVLVILYSWLSGLHTRQSVVQNNKQGLKIKLTKYTNNRLCTRLDSFTKEMYCNYFRTFTSLIRKLIAGAVGFTRCYVSWPYWWT